MSVTCASCGSANESTYKFCRTCGKPLATIGRADEVSPAPPVPTPEPATPGEAAPPPPAPLGEAAATPPTPTPVPPPLAPVTTPVVAPVVAPPVAPVAPVVAPPAAPPAPLVLSSPAGPRVPLPVLIGVLVAVLGVGAAVGIVLGRGPVDPDPGTTTPGGTSAAETPRPSAEPSDVPVSTASAGPVTSPSPSAPSTATPRPTAVPPTAAPTPTPGTGGTGVTQVASTRYVSVTVPADWEVKANEFTVTVFPTVGGSLFLESGALTNAGAPKTSAEWIKGEIAWRQKKFPDVKICGAEQDFTVFNGPAGRAVTLCYTATTTTGASYRAIVHVFGAVIVDGNETLLFHQKIYAKAEAWKDVVAAVNPVLRSTRWTLFGGS